jgi:hypothetical protein
MRIPFPWYDGYPWRSGLGGKKNGKNEKRSGKREQAVSVNPVLDHGCCYFVHIAVRVPTVPLDQKLRIMQPCLPSDGKKFQRRVKNWGSVVNRRKQESGSRAVCLCDWTGSGMAEWLCWCALSVLLHGQTKGTVLRWGEKRATYSIKVVVQRQTLGLLDGNGPWGSDKGKQAVEDESRHGGMC